jgi:KTSC domain
MARNKKHSRTETVFTDPAEAARHVAKLRAAGGSIYGTRAAMASVGLQPHHYAGPAYDSPTRGKPRLDEGLPEAEAVQLANQADMTLGPVHADFATSTSNPADPRTVAAGYDPVLQRLRIEWGDGGPAYNYYNVPPQIWESFLDAPSPGRYINAVLNYFSYGVASE